MLRLFLAVFAIGALFASTQVSAQSLSIGNGKIIYQILFKEWANPADKLWTGKKCDIIGRRCDTQFLGYVDVLSDDTRRSGKDYTWPGPNKNENKWPLIGKKSQKGARLTDFAYVNLTGVENGKFREAILRVKVIDKDLIGSDEINSYIGRLPGLQDLVVKRYESDAEFSEPIILEPLSTALPGTRKGKADRSAVQQQHLYVVVRAWGEDLTRSHALTRPAVSGKRRPPVREDTLSSSNSDDDSGTSTGGRSRKRSGSSVRDIPIIREQDDVSSDGGGGSYVRSKKPLHSDDYFQRRLNRNN